MGRYLAKQVQNSTCSTQALCTRTNNNNNTCILPKSTHHRHPLSCWLTRKTPAVTLRLQTPRRQRTTRTTTHRPRSAHPARRMRWSTPSKGAAQLQLPLARPTKWSMTWRFKRWWVEVVVAAGLGPCMTLGSRWQLIITKCPLLAEIVTWAVYPIWVLEEYLAAARSLQCHLIWILWEGFTEVMMMIFAAYTVIRLSLSRRRRTGWFVICVFIRTMIWWHPTTPRIVTCFLFLMCPATSKNNLTRNLYSTNSIWAKFTNWHLIK